MKISVDDQGKEINTVNDEAKAIGLVNSFGRDEIAAKAVPRETINAFIICLRKFFTVLDLHDYRKRFPVGGSEDKDFNKCLKLALMKRFPVG